MHHSITPQEVDALRHAARMVVRELGLLNDAYFDIGVTLAERHLLIELEASLYPDVGEIAERLLLDKSSASRLIAKAVKKGFVKYTQDESDKRRRCLQITPEGRKTLQAFEPLAQKQVQEALLTLKNEEVQIVQKGISLFANGLSRARLRKTFTLHPLAQQDILGLAKLMPSDRDVDSLFEVSQQKGRAYFVLRKGAKVVAGAGIAPFQDGCEVHKLTVRNDLCQLGLEDLLIEECLKEAQRQGYRLCKIGQLHKDLP